MKSVKLIFLKKEGKKKEFSLFNLYEFYNIKVKLLFAEVELKVSTII